jgi:hypothetical protein
MERTMDQRVTVNFCVKLQKSPSKTLLMLNQFMMKPQAKEPADVEVQDQNNVDLLSRHQEYHPLSICAQRDHC